MHVRVYPLKEGTEGEIKTKGNSWQGSKVSEMQAPCYPAIKLHFILILSTKGYLLVHLCSK